jgi:hypothetical protein
MSNSTEDDKIKAFVQALTLALQNIVSEPPESAGTKRKPKNIKRLIKAKQNASIRSRDRREQVERHNNVQ